MATVYKQQNRPCFMVAWYDGTGKRRVRSSGTTDRKAAERLAAKLEADSMLRREGIIDVRADQFATAARRPIDAHVQEFIRFLRAKGNTEKHVLDRQAQLTRLITGMKVTLLTELTPGRAQNAMAEMRADGLGLRTASRYIVAIKAFTKWLVREGRVASDPLVGLTGYNADADRRRERRALTGDEIAKLVAAAERGRKVFGLSGPDRAMLYRLALGTGFRANELGSLTPESFHLDADPPTVVVKAGYSKRRREDVQPIRDDLAAMLRTWLVGRPAKAPVFAVNRLFEKTAPMIQFDLNAAGVPYVDEDGKVGDFHSLRHTYVSAVVRGGASVKEAQTLARHSDPSLTFRVYAHARLHELRRALDAMPSTTV